MRLVRLVAFLIITAIAFQCRVSAASFTDDMTVPQNTAEVQYSGLKPYDSATYGLSDQTLLTFLNSSAPQGYALYRVNAAETITVGIYTSYGTCVSQQETGLMLSQGTKQAAWSKSKNEIYSDFGGSFWRIELDFESRFDPLFSPVSALPEDTLGFGLNIYALPGTGKPLTAYVTKSVSEALSYEEYTAPVPAGTQYIKVEINDVTAYPLKSGGTMPNRVYTSLALVKISGEALVMGEPAKVESSQTPTYNYNYSYDDEDEEDEEKKEASSVSSAASVPPEEMEPEEPEPAASSEKSSSSKFEGTITSSSKASKPEKSQAPKAAAPAESSSPKSERSESEPPKDEIPREAVYEIRREDADNGMSSGVTAYIIIVSGALALLLIFGRKK